MTSFHRHVPLEHNYNQKLGVDTHTQEEPAVSHGAPPTVVRAND